MPCTYFTPEEERQNARREYNELVAQINELTDLLCQANKLLEKTPLHVQGSRLHNWWLAHKRMDAARIKDEKAAKAKRRAESKLKENALAKLTPEEQQALGIKD